jgi:uncharacterized membrane protein YdfJ with MMPL/SSD domain
MLGLLVLRQTLLNGVAIAAAATVAMTVIASLTLLPALLGFTGLRLARPSRLNTFLGGKVFRGGARGRKVSGGGARGGKVFRGGARGRKVSGGGARGGKVCGDGAPRSTVVPGARTPVRSAEKKMHPAERWARVVQAHPVLATVLSAAVILILAAPALAMKLSMLDDTVLPRSGLTAYLTGPNAANVSFTNLIGERLPLLIGVVVALSLGLLLVVFRSVVIAVKAALMNLLSVCAAYGVLTAPTGGCPAGWTGCRRPGGPRLSARTSPRL